MKLRPMSASRLLSSSKVSGSWRKLCSSSQLVPIRGSMESEKCFSLGNSCVREGAGGSSRPPGPKQMLGAPVYARGLVVSRTEGQVENLPVFKLGHLSALLPVV